MSIERYNCRVCGFYNDDLPWGSDGKSPTFEICVCCGVEFGNEDYSLESAKKYREKWIVKGAIWFEPKEKPNKWSLENQLLSIPDEFK